MSVCARSRGTAGIASAKPGGGAFIIAGITFIILSYTEREHNMPTYTVHLNATQTKCQHNLILFLYW